MHVPVSAQVEERSVPLEVSVCTGKCRSVTSKGTELPLGCEGEKDTQKKCILNDSYCLLN
ncbi:hypothetical protein EK904_013809 [Melospiza melodia maxima]|nr:hypothetical protein EK904_013809 [Melospiza melodia maxima]